MELRSHSLLATNSWLFTERLDILRITRSAQSRLRASRSKKWMSCVHGTKARERGCADAVSEFLQAKWFWEIWVAPTAKPTRLLDRQLTSLHVFAVQLWKARFCSLRWCCILLSKPFLPVGK